MNLIVISLLVLGLTGLAAALLLYLTAQKASGCQLRWLRFCGLQGFG